MSSKKEFSVSLLPGFFTFMWLALFLTGNCESCGGTKDYVEMWAGDGDEDD